MPPFHSHDAFDAYPELLCDSIRHFNCRNVKSLKGKNLFGFFASILLLLIALYTYFFIVDLLGVG